MPRADARDARDAPSRFVPQSCTAVVGFASIGAATEKYQLTSRGHCKAKTGRAGFRPLLWTPVFVGGGKGGGMGGGGGGEMGTSIFYILNSDIEKLLGSCIF